MLNEQRIGLSSIKAGGEYRNVLLQKLDDIGIATRQGTHAVHMLGYYRNRFGYVPEDYINAYACDYLSITLPLYVGITAEEQEYIVDTIKKTINVM